MITTHSINTKLRDLSDNEFSVGQMVFEKSFAIKPDERVLVVTDPTKRNEAAIFFESAKKYSNLVTCMVFDGMHENAQEPPTEIALAMRETDILLLVTHYSLSHTKARHEATVAGVRIASLPGITMDMMKRTLTADPSGFTNQTLRLADLLTNHEIVTITSDAGTNISFSIKGRNGIPDTGILDIAGEFGNLPAGESFVAPVEGTAHGTIVIDGAIADIELDETVFLTIEKGNITAIKGNIAAKELERRINLVGPKARILCELGIGTNPTAILCPNVLEAEKVYGTCHIAFGNNSGFGGTNSVLFHTDVVLKNPTLSLDGKIILENNSLNI